MRGVANQAYAGELRREVGLIEECARMPAGARAGCASWFGQTFNVIANGRFGSQGCGRLGRPLRGDCEAGARRWLEPLVTFA